MDGQEENTSVVRTVILEEETPKRVSAFVSAYSARAKRGVRSVAATYRAHDGGLPVGQCKTKERRETGTP